MILQLSIYALYGYLIVLNAMYLFAVRKSIENKNFLVGLFWYCVFAVGGVILIVIINFFK